MSKDNGGPAFPHEFGGTYQNQKREGMTLRDYFAAKAMQAYCAAQPNFTPQRHAKNAYELADAMLLERNKLAKIAVSDAPGIVRQRFAGEIDMAYKLGLIDYTEHDQHTTALAAACKHRLDELHAAKLKRLGIKE